MSTVIFMKLSKKVKLARKTKSYKQKEFANLLNCGLTTITNYEGGHSEPNSKFMQKICHKFPQYTLWLMTGQTQTSYQISPELDTEPEKREVTPNEATVS